MLKSESKHMCSWWWASHISPKNSKWLQENLTDMDTKVKLMIKLIEVDEDSFARRAEMYYKKRPELMKLVEEFYRAYRALAERYDHATGVIRHAHKTMAQAFPNQVSFLESEDGSFSSADDLVELQKGVIALTRSDLYSAERNRSFRPREAPLAKLAEGVRIALNIYDTNKGAESQKNELFPEMIQGLSQSERLDRSEAEIRALNEALAKLEAEKEAELLQYKKSVQRLSNLESEVFRAQEDSKGFHERASKGEVEVQSLKESLVKLEKERESTLSQYQQCLERISSLETDVSRAQEEADKRACEAENEVQVLKEELAQLKTEKEDWLAKYVEALENIANLESKLLLAEYKASLTSERVDNAEKEVATLKEALSRITEEKEAAALQYQQCLHKIASLENEIALSREAVDRLKAEMDRGAEKLKGTEEQCLVLERSNKCMQNELESALFKVGVQNEDISGQQKEMGRLWTCIQEERVRCVEAETAFRTLKSLHSQTQEELRSVGIELEKRIQLLKDMEVHNQNLQGEVQKIRDENKILNDINVNSSVALERMQDEILNLKEGKIKLNEELELRLDQRNTLQLEICCLKEELNSLDKKHRAMLEQVESVDLQPDCFVLSVKDLQVENSKLKEAYQNSEAEMSFLLEKLGVMEKLVEKNAVLEHSLSELNDELEGARVKVKALEDSWQMLMNEKSITTENLEKLSERNTFLMNTLFDVNAELEALRTNSRNLEDSCHLLNDEKSILVNEREALELKLETAHQRLEELGRKHADLEKSYHGMEDEHVALLRLVEDLHNSLATKSQEHDNSTQLSQMQITEMGSKICLLQELVEQTRDQLEEELDKAVSTQFEIFILRNTLQDLRGTNSSLLKNCEKLLETSTLSEKFISKLKHVNSEQKEEVCFLSEQITRLRMGMFRLLEELEVDFGHLPEGTLDQDQMVMHRILAELDDRRGSLFKAWDENMKLVIEKSVLVTVLGQLQPEVADLKTLIKSLQQESSKRNDHLSSLQRDMPKLLDSNENLLLRVREGDHKEELLASGMESLRTKLQEMQGICQDLESENGRILEENKSLRKVMLDLSEEKHKIELENSCLVVEAVTLDTLSFVLKNIVLEGSDVIKHLTDEVYNCVPEDKVRILDGMLGEYQMENLCLRASLEKYDGELKEMKKKHSQLEYEFSNDKEKLLQKELELLLSEALNEEQGKQIHEVSERYNQQLTKSECLEESMQNLEAEICIMQAKQKETNRKVEVLRSDLKKQKTEAGQWESVADTFFVEMQTSSVCETLYREKLVEVTKEHQCFNNKNYSDGLEVMQLKETVRSLESKNSQVEARWAGYLPTMTTLRDAVASLERHVFRTETDTDEDTSRYYSLSKDKGVTGSTSDGLSDLLDIAVRIKAVDNKVKQAKILSKEKSLRALKSQNPSDDHHHYNVTKQLNQSSDNEEAGDELAMKDIMLDQVSETSSRRKNMKDWYYNTESDDQILDLWETTHKPGNSQKEQYSSEIPVEKELRIDSLELSKRYLELNELESNNKIQDRLASDVQKLNNLQITIQDLKQKVVSKAKDTEYTIVKEKLEEAERETARLLDVNCKMAKHADNCSAESPSFPFGDPSDIEGSERRKVCEQAMRCSEKIERLQVEVQKIQFIVVKLDDSNKFVEPDRKVLLRDYLYGKAHMPRRRKNTRFCGCIQSSTTGD